MHFFTLFLFVLVLLLQAADAYLTLRILAAGGRELNPITRFLMAKLGAGTGLVAAKVAVAIAVGLLLLEYPLAMLVVVALYAWVVWHNWKQFSHQGGKA